MAGRSTSPKTPIWLTTLRYAFLIGVLFVLLFGYQVVRLYTDWMWFGEVRQSAAFGTMLGAKLLLFFGLGVVFFLVCYSNLWMAQRMNERTPILLSLDLERQQFGAVVRRASRWISLGAAILLAFLVGGNAATHWSEYLLFTHVTPFHVADPVFHYDIGFYVFRVPFLMFLQGWVLFTLFVTALGVAIVYYADQGIDFMAGGTPRMAPHVRNHLLVLLGFLAMVLAWGHLLGRYDLLVADNGPFFGAGYTDVHVRLPAANILAWLMVTTGLLCFANVRVGRPFRLPLVGFGAYAVAWVALGSVWPAVVQRFQVDPNQVARETQYISQDIELTRRAFGLDRVRVQDVTSDTTLSASDLARNEATIRNVRLWDWPQLGAVYTAKEALATYYRFTLPEAAPTSSGALNIDVDRYPMDGQLRQVMVGARELVTDALPAQARTWQNQHLIYTHGYGAVMSPVNEVDQDGLPQYFLSGIPVRSQVPGLEVNRPQIYYGELTSDYVFVDTKQEEFDYPAQQGNQATRYTGGGGVRLGGLLQKTAWSARLGDANMLLSSDLGARSRILFRRNVRERVQTIAPVLNWDNDPYLVADGGRLVWILDGYTATDRYPYSRPFSAGTGIDGVSQELNYIRNSVKATVDAYDGTTTFYVADDADPMIATYRRIFPSMFRPLAEMPAGLKQHLRYPEDLFRIQREIYQTYHVTDAQVYYSKEDQWVVPEDPTPPTDSQGDVSAVGPTRMMPYYVTMRLPGESKEEFLLMTPFAPLARQNLSGWLCARCDPGAYGQLVVYRFPKRVNVNGPQQIISQIKSQEDISKYQTLLGKAGSKVIFGNLLVIPVESSLLYAVPLYVQATDPGTQAIPQIRQVIVATGNRIAMRPTLKQAVAALASGEAPAAGLETETPTGASAPGVPSGAPPTPNALPPTGGTPADALRRANAAYERARRQQQDYDATLRDLGAALKELEKGMSRPKP